MYIYIYMHMQIKVELAQHVLTIQPCGHPESSHQWMTAGVLADGFQKCCGMLPSGKLT